MWRHATTVAAAATAAAIIVWRLRRRARKLSSKALFDPAAPVLCFGDSLTAGYHGVWHSVYAPQMPQNPNCDEVDNVRFRPYAVRLGARLATAAGLTGFDVNVGSALRYAEERSYSGWTAAELLPRLEASLRGVPWRAVVLLAGTNDIVCYGETAAVASERVHALLRCCDEHGVPVLVVTPPDCATDQHGLVPPEKAEERRMALSTLATELRTAARAQGRVVVDARRWLPSQVEVGSETHAWCASFWDDCLHFSPKGSDALADLVFDALSGLASQPGYRPSSECFL